MAPPLPTVAPPGPAELARLVDAARAAREQAYAPSSRFRVGAALLDERRRVHATGMKETVQQKP